MKKFVTQVENEMKLFLLLARMLREVLENDFVSFSSSQKKSEFFFLILIFVFMKFNY